MQNALFLVPTFLQAQPTHPDPWRQDQQKPEPDQKVTYQKPCHKKQAVMAAEDVAAVRVFDWALSVAPLSAGVVRHHRENSLRPALERWDLILMALCRFGMRDSS